MRKVGVTILSIFLFYFTPLSLKAYSFSENIFPQNSNQASVYVLKTLIVNFVMDYKTNLVMDYKISKSGKLIKNKKAGKNLCKPVFTTGPLSILFYREVSDKVIKKNSANNLLQNFYVFRNYEFSTDNVKIETVLKTKPFEFNFNNSFYDLSQVALTPYSQKLVKPIDKQTQAVVMYFVKALLPLFNPLS